MGLSTSSGYSLNVICDGLPEGHFRLARVDGAVVLVPHPLGVDLQMELPHAWDDRLHQECQGNESESFVMIQTQNC